MHFVSFSSNFEWLGEVWDFVRFVLTHVCCHLRCLPCQRLWHFLCVCFACLALTRDADETISWIQEKDAVLSSDDYGRDLASVQTLQRKHEGVERDLAALEEKVRPDLEITRWLMHQSFSQYLYCCVSSKTIHTHGMWHGVNIHMEWGMVLRPFRIICTFTITLTSY